MNSFIIEKYLKRITKTDINNYAKKQGINLTTNELDILYYYLQTKHKDFLTNKRSQLELLEELKSKVNKNTANKLEELYQQYKYKL